ncbi:MAG: cysteine desulfurase [Brevundimonas sp.]|nr:MAG: cysteine desulfurase [Brevundimonas sp.]
MVSTGEVFQWMDLRRPTCQPTGDPHQWIGAMSTLGYFDYLGSSPLDPRVRDVMVAAWDHPGNSGAQDHAFGWRAAAAVEAARRKVAEALGAEAEEITFTSGATEANNLLMLGAARAAPEGRRRILVSSIEHKSVLSPAQVLAGQGYDLAYVATDATGRVDPDALRAHLDPSVAVVSIMAVNNEIGVIQNVEALSAVVTASGAFFHVDATQAPNAMAVDLHAWGCDGASFSAHKLYGPGGIGAAYVSEAAPWRPLPLLSGGGQEEGLRAGTVPHVLCSGFATACELLQSQGAEDRAHAEHLRAKVLAVLQGRFPDLQVTAARAPRHPGCLHVRLPGVDAADLLLRLQPTVAAAIGSACTSGQIGTSHVLRSLGWDDPAAGEALRLSVGRFTTDADVAVLDHALSALWADAA